MRRGSTLPVRHTGRPLIYLALPAVFADGKLVLALESLYDYGWLLMQPMLKKVS